VLIKSVLLNHKSGGGSTLTQQLVKNLFPRKRFLLFSTLINKFREMHLAHRFERIYTKDEIFWKYCATVSFGEQAFGLASASQQFFSKAPDDLLLEEAALLAGAYLKPPLITVRGVFLSVHESVEMWCFYKW
jgi:penicillin-binding protein 1A